jgi:hypothetical protein
LGVGVGAIVAGVAGARSSPTAFACREGAPL